MNQFKDGYCARCGGFMRYFKNKYTCRDCDSPNYVGMRKLKYMGRDAYKLC